MAPPTMNILSLHVQTWRNLLARVDEDQAFPTVISAHSHGSLDDPPALSKGWKVSVQDLCGVATSPSDGVSDERPACAVSGLYRCLHVCVGFHSVCSFVMGL